LSYRREYILEAGIEEVYEKAVSHALPLGWSVRREDGSIVLEDGKDVNYSFVATLLILGLLTLWIFFVGVLLWIMAVIYVVIASNHSAAIVAVEKDRYMVYASSVKGVRIAGAVFKMLGGRGVKRPKPLKKVEDMYEELKETYYQIWGFYGRNMLEKEIKKLMEKGLTREEAITSLYTGRR